MIVMCGSLRGAMHSCLPSCYVVKVYVDNDGDMIMVMTKEHSVMKELNPFNVSCLASVWILCCLKFGFSQVRTVNVAHCDLDLASMRWESCCSHHDDATTHRRISMHRDLRCNDVRTRQAVRSGSKAVLPGFCLSLTSARDSA